MGFFLHATTTINAYPDWRLRTTPVSSHEDPSYCLPYLEDCYDNTQKCYGADYPLYQQYSRILIPLIHGVINYILRFSQTEYSLGWADCIGTWTSTKCRDLWRLAPSGRSAGPYGAEEPYSKDQSLVVHRCRLRTTRRFDFGRQNGRPCEFASCSYRRRLLPLETD